MNKTDKIKFTLSAVFIFVFTFATMQPASVVRAQGVQRSINVSGDADVKVVPDEVVLTLGVETHDMNLSTAKKDNDERVQRIISISKEMGIESKYVQTNFISIQPRYKDSYDQQTFFGYWVQKTIVVTLKDLTKFEDLLTQFLEAGANYVQGIQFRTTELR